MVRTASAPRLSGPAPLQAALALQTPQHRRSNLHRSQLRPEGRMAPRPGRRRGRGTLRVSSWNMGKNPYPKLKVEEMKAIGMSNRAVSLL